MGTGPAGLGPGTAARERAPAPPWGVTPGAVRIQMHDDAL